VGELLSSTSYLDNQLLYFTPRISVDSRLGILHFQVTRIGTRSGLTRTNGWKDQRRILDAKVWGEAGAGKPESNFNARFGDEWYRLFEDGCLRPRGHIAVNFFHAGCLEAKTSRVIIFMGTLRP
jgi:hypothetical protein